MADRDADGPLLILTRGDVERLLPMAMAIEIVRTAANEYSAGRGIVPPRPHIVTAAPAGEMLFMPGYMPQMQAIGVKVWSRFEFDGSSGPTTSALIVYRDLERGIEVVMDAGYVTDMRTGAMSALACEYLAPRSAARGAIIGAGIQARTQLEALVTATGVAEIFVWSRTPDRAAEFVASASARYPDHDIRLAASAAAAIEGADIVLAATTAATPVVDDRWVKPEALVCGIGSHTRATAEIDPRTVARAEVILVDSREAVLSGAADIAQPIADGLIDAESIVELGEVAARGVMRGYRAPAVFKSVGFAALDVAAAKAVTDAAVEASIGQWVDLH